MSNQAGVTETLMGIDYDLKLSPRLSESVEQASPTTWQVTLREGVEFHDGTPLTAEAVVASISGVPVSRVLASLPVKQKLPRQARKFL